MVRSSTGPVGETRDADRSGAGDHDIAFTFGSPKGFLTTRALAKLIIMRGYVMDVRHGEHHPERHADAALGDLIGDPPASVPKAVIPEPEKLEPEKSEPLEPFPIE